MDEKVKYQWLGCQLPYRVEAKLTHYNGEQRGVSAVVLDLVVSMGNTQLYKLYNFTADNGIYGRDDEYMRRVIKSLTRKATWTRMKAICRQRLYAAIVSQRPGALDGFVDKSAE